LANGARVTIGRGDVTDAPIETCPHDPKKRKRFGVRHMDDGLDYCETCWKVLPESLEAMQNRPTPAGLAREARERGDRFFEIQLEVGESRRDVSFGHADSGDRSAEQHGGTLGAIEAEGWRLESTGYVFVPTGQSSRQKVLGSGESVAVSGIIVGIYLFRQQ
jgi:hypothetical protein